MRVLFLTREYPPFEVGGVARHTYHLVEHLRELGVECRVLSFGDSRMSDNETTFIDPSSSIISRSAGSISSDAGIIADIARYGRFARRLIDDDGGFDIVHVEEPYVGALVTHKRKVTTVHDTSYGEMKSILHHPSGLADLKRAIFYLSLGPYLERRCLASSRAVMVPAAHVKHELASIYGYEESLIYVTSNGIELPDSVDKPGARNKLLLPSSELLIFTTAQHVARKRLDTLVEAIRLVRDSGADGFRVVISGQGPLTPYLKRLARKHGLDGLIYFPGWVSEELLELYYQAADVFVLTSDYEGGPISLLEAMSRGDAVISSSIDGFPRLMKNGVDGILFPVGDARALGGCIRALLQEQELRRSLSSSAIVFAQRFTWDRVAEQAKTLYESLN